MESANRIDQELLDRLVDGELDEPTRRRVIAALQREAGGWERCALSFLEAQAFQEAIRDCYAGAELHQAGKSAPRPARANRTLNWSSVIAIAACLVIAFSLGRQMSDQRSGAPETAPAIAQSAPVENARAAFPDLWRGESVLNRDMQNVFEQMGLRVDRHQGFVSEMSPDGQRLLIPFEELHFHKANATPQ